MHRLTVNFVLLSICCLAAAGCGPGLQEVTGKVTLDGKPVQGLEVNFEPVDPSTGGTATGYTQADGSFKLHYPGRKTGAPPGEYIVRIVGAEVDDGPPVRVPAKYGSKSELKATVGSGEPHVFELTTK